MYKNSIGTLEKLTVTPSIEIFARYPLAKYKQKRSKTSIRIFEIKIPNQRPILKTCLFERNESDVFAVPSWAQCIVTAQDNASWKMSA